MRYEPHDYQQYAISYIETHPVAAVLLDMGLGKTSITLTYCQAPGGLDCRPEFLLYGLLSHANASNPFIFQAAAFW